MNSDRTIQMRRRQVLAELQQQRRRPRFIYNDDSCTLRCAPPPHTVESLDRVVTHNERESELVVALDRREEPAR